MLRLHDYPPSANCYKVRLLLAQLGLEYERVEVDIFGGDTLTDEFGRMNPARRTQMARSPSGAASDGDLRTTSARSARRFAPS